MVLGIVATLVMAAPETLATLLTGAPVLVMDVATGKTPPRRGTLAKLAEPEKCVLTLEYAPAQTGPARVALRDVRLVQGDGDAMIEISLASKPEESVIFTVGRERYAGAAALLTKRAKACGARLVGPPPLISTRP